MKSKINIEFPFTTVYDSAYKVTSQGRNTVVLYSTVTKERTSISYAKYLMSVHLKRWLTNDEHVDHINNDKSDDRIENYQILTLAENNKKQASVIGCQVVEYKCAICGNKFVVKRKHSHFTIKGKSMTCSRSCGGKASHLTTPIQNVLREYNWYDEHHWSDQLGNERRKIP